MHLNFQKVCNFLLQFRNYYKLINLAYLYDKTHYDLQTSTGEKYYYFNLLQDDRFKKENIQEFISNYCRKHNKQILSEQPEHP